MSHPAAFAVLIAIVLAVISLGAFALMLTGDWLGEDGHEAVTYVALGGTVAAMALAGFGGSGASFGAPRARPPEE